MRRTGGTARRRVIEAVAALCVSGALLAFLASGLGPVPPLGQALDPGTGVWASAEDAAGVRSETLRLPGLRGPVTVSFSPAGVPTVAAGSDGDLFEALGYTHARFRLTQMDLQRRLGSGRMAELVGPAGVESDKFQLQLGLLRTAEAQWAATPHDSESAVALLAYARGVNAWIGQARAAHRRPALFSLTGVHPADWTPVDSLVVQGVLTENTSFTTGPLALSILQRSLGERHTREWFPVLPPNAQRPYDPGPYEKAVSKPAAAGRAPAVRDDGATAATADRTALAWIAAQAGGSAGSQRNSNAWAVNGPLAAGGRAMLAGDPHLPHTLPSYWFQAALRSPGYSVTGFTLPGMPAVLIGRNEHISWTVTNAQTQSTFYYREVTDPHRPGEYYWRGAWRRMERLTYAIPVRGGAPVRLTVDLTVHGPVMTQLGQTMSVYWTGATGSPSLTAILSVARARDFDGFTAALRDWHSPAQNFVYADDAGNIGAVAAGHFPIVASGEPWLPLPGTGAADVTGMVPYEAAPRVYNPPDHMVVSANDRPVGAGYPYYLGPSTGFDPGYRTRRIRDYLGSRRAMTKDDFTALQHDVTDGLAIRIVPRLLDALRDDRLTPAEREARAQLAAWQGAMDPGSGAAAVWWTFWNAYLTAVFQPWWTAGKVPVHLDPGRLAISASQTTLSGSLESWTLRDQDNAAFTPPRGRARTAREVMRAAFHRAIADLSARLGPSPQSWAWGRVHSVSFPSLTGAPGLGYGPLPAGGDPQTVNAAGGDMSSVFGPSMRMVVNWVGESRSDDATAYPGGQSENPGSPWYRNLLAEWLSGRYRPLPVPGAGSSPVTWTLSAGREDG